MQRPKIGKARVADCLIFRAQVPARPEGAANRHPDAGPRCVRANGGNVDCLWVLDAYFDEIETDRLDAVDNPERSIGEGRNPDKRARAIPHSKAPMLTRSNSLPAPDCDQGYSAASQHCLVKKFSGSSWTLNVRSGEGFRTPAP